MASDDDYSMGVASAGDDDLSVFGDDENLALNRVKGVKGGVADKPAVLHASTNEGKKKKRVEDIYQKKSQLEHILLRPDTYIGSTEQNEANMFVVQDDRIVQRSVTYTPGLFKIFDEIMVNAADNKQRDPTMDKIEVTIDEEANWISVMNNGKGIPIEIHSEYNMYVPTLIFGELLTGSNFDDDEKKTTGGRNGYGAKLANVFSTQFDVECVDTESGKHFKQTFRSNMGKREEPIVKNLTKAQQKKGDYVKISFSPDLPRFKMTCLDDDIVGLMKRRAYDVAASLASSPGKKLSVSLNGTKLPVKSFEDYIKCIEGVNKPIAFQKVDRWEVGVALCETGSLGQISFVNSIFTSKGGQHVEYISKQVVSHLVNTLKKKKQDVPRQMIKNHLFLFVNTLIENPAFDSQTKEELTTKPQFFGSKCNLTADFFKKVDKSEIVEMITSFNKFNEQRKLKGKGGTKKSKLTGISKLDDANFAGTAKSKDCTLIITEGDSAKSLAMAGLSVVGRDHFGVFPLRGKPLNVRDATLKQVMANEEIKNLVQIMGLKFGQSYDESNIKSLRYGHLMIMADQDTDGSHIKGLIINIMHHFWPTLLDVPGFLQQFITPIVKATKGKKVKTFFNLPEYENWLESTGNNGKGWSIKYYKGLGTSTSAEAKDYFSHLDLHEINFSKLSNDKFEAEDDFDAVLPDTVQSGSDMIDMLFRKDRVNERKRWLETKVSSETFLDYSAVGKVEGVKYSEFLNKEYILFSTYDNVRSIPHIMDGFKPSQRKVLFGCLKRKLRGEIKVAQLTGYVAEHSAYHHGEQSLQGTIVAMASNYCGSNNINLLTPSGQFGTRRMGGKDAASARYIFTKLEAITRTIFHPDDDQLLNYLKDDGNSIEPDFYVPVIPMILVNGADGIGSGWSSNVPNFNPRDIIANLRRMISQEDVVSMTPYYHGFTGAILSKGDGKYAVEGKIERTDDETILITELPIKKWTQDYKEMLEKMVTGDDKKQPEILDFKENHTETTVSFTIKAKKEKIDEFEKETGGGLYKKFKLLGSISTSNLVVFKDGKLCKLESPEDILKSFYDVRSEYYVKRKALLVENLQTEQRKLSNKARFVEEVCSGDLIVSNRKRKEILSELQDRGYETFLKTESNSTDEESDEDDDTDEELSTAELAKGYEYLLGMKIWSLTYEKAEALRAELAIKTQELEKLIATTPNEIWLNDLASIEEALDERDAAFEQAACEEKKAQVKSKKVQAKAAKKTQKKKKKKDEWDSDLESDEDNVVVMSDDSSDDEMHDKVALQRKIASSKSGIKKTTAKTKPKPTTNAKALKTSDASSTYKMDVDEESTLIKHTKPVADKAEEISNKRRSDSSSESKLVHMESIDDDDDDDMVLDLAARVKKRLSTTSISPKSASDESQNSVSGEAPAKKMPAKRAAAGAAKKTKGKSKSVPKKVTQKKKATVVDSDESEDDFQFKSDDDEEEEVAGVTNAESRSRRARATATKKYYNFDSDDGSDSDF